MLTVGTSLRAAPARPHLVLLLQEHLQDLLGEEEEVEAPEHHGGFGNVVIFLGVEAKGLRVTEASEGPAASPLCLCLASGTILLLSALSLPGFGGSKISILHLCPPSNPPARPAAPQDLGSGAGLLKAGSKSLDAEPRERFPAEGGLAATKSQLWPPSPGASSLRTSLSTLSAPLRLRRLPLQRAPRERKKPPKKKEKEKERRGETRRSSPYLGNELEEGVGVESSNRQSYEVEEQPLVKGLLHEGHHAGSHQRAEGDDGDAEETVTPDCGGRAKKKSSPPGGNGAKGKEINAGKGRRGERDPRRKGKREEGGGEKRTFISDCLFIWNWFKSGEPGAEWLWK